MKPILFSTPMVQAILEGRKTQTRRVLKPQPLVHNEVIKMPIPVDEYSKILKQYVKKGYTEIYTKGVLQGMIAPRCPFGEVGDTIWVRETWCDPSNTGYPILYKADFPMVYRNDAEGEPDIVLKEEGYKWKPSIFMPKDACRLFLKITNIRVERLQDISELDAECEGAKKMPLEHLGGAFPNHKSGFESLWQSINGKESWDCNPYVWVIEFEKIKNQ